MNPLGENDAIISVAYSVKGATVSLSVGGDSIAEYARFGRFAALWHMFGFLSGIVSSIFMTDVTDPNRPLLERAFSGAVLIVLFFMAAWALKALRAG